MIASLNQGRGGIVCLIGEAGIGKSRLIEEMKVMWHQECDPGQLALWSEARSVPYDASLPYGLFRQWFKQACGITQDDPPEVMRQKLAAMMEDMPLEMGKRSIRVFELLLAIAAQSDQPKPPARTSQSQQQASRPLTGELFEVFLNLLRDLGANRSGVIVFDDLHWADEASVALLCHLFRLTKQAPLLFLCAFRPYRESPAWKIKSTALDDYPDRYMELTLGPLSASDSQVLVESLLQAVDLPSQVHQHILKKAEGNPFFVEEIVRSLIEKSFVLRDERGPRWQTGLQVEHLAIPDNVQALLAARIDRLGKEIRRTLQLASVIGRSFYRRVLHRAMEEKASIDEHLTALQQVELIRLVAQAPELEYAFRQELTRDVAYQSILRRHRREFQRRVGAALESLYPERLEELAPGSDITSTRHAMTNAP